MKADANRRQPDAGEATKEAGRPDICVLVNGGSGTGPAEGDQRIADLRAALARHPGRFELRPLGPEPDVTGAARQALADGFGTVVAAGGDGTVGGVAAEMAGSGRRFGVLPLGTFNYFARSSEIPEDLEGAVDVLVGGETREVTIGEVNGQVFLNNASLGAYAAILERREQVYRTWGRGRVAAYWSVLTTLARIRTPMSLRVSVDGTAHRLRTPLVFVIRNAFQLRQFGLPGEECLLDGGFAVFIAPDCTRLGMIRYALRLATGTMVEGRDFDLLCGHEIRVETRRRRRLVARDGERKRLTGPFVFRICDGPLRMLVPPAAGAAEAREARGDAREVPAA